MSPERRGTSKMKRLSAVPPFRAMRVFRNGWLRSAFSRLTSRMHFSSVSAEKPVAAASRCRSWSERFKALPPRSGREPAPARPGSRPHELPGPAIAVEVARLCRRPRAQRLEVSFLDHELLAVLLEVEADARDR